MSYANPPVELNESFRNFLAELLREQHGVELGHPEASSAVPAPASSAEGDAPDDETEDDYACYCQECGDEIEGMTEEEFADDSELHLCEACEIASGVY
jgi:hypothetical protein